MAVADLGKLNLEEAPLLCRNVDCFKKLQQIGEGPYGEVYKAKDIETGEIVALKKIRIDENGREGFPVKAIRLIKILSKLRHRNVVRYKEVVVSSGQEGDNQGEAVLDNNKYKGGIYMVFEYMDHDLSGLVNRPRLKFTVPQIKCYIKQLLTGLHYCHANHLFHRDIKGSNILIDNEGNLKLGGFELARTFPNEQIADLTYQASTLHYRPPEVLLGSRSYGPAIDIWSVGCVFAELLKGKGKPILPGRTDFGQLKKIYALCGSPDETNWPGVSELPWYPRYKSPQPMKRRLLETYKHFDGHALELLDQMLVLDPSKRISAKDALDSDYFWSGPLPCDPKSLPSYESSHEFQMKKYRNGKAARKLKMF